MAELHKRHRPFKNSHPKTGMLSRKPIRWPHVGQHDLPKTTDLPRGTRYATTFKKLPIMPPRAQNHAAANASTDQIRINSVCDISESMRCSAALDCGHIFSTNGKTIMYATNKPAIATHRPRRHDHQEAVCGSVSRSYSFSGIIEIKKYYFCIQQTDVRRVSLESLPS